MRCYYVLKSLLTFRKYSLPHTFHYSPTSSPLRSMQARRKSVPITLVEEALKKNTFGRMFN